MQSHCQWGTISCLQQHIGVQIIELAVSCNFLALFWEETLFRWNKRPHISNNVLFGALKVLESFLSRVMLAPLSRAVGTGNNILIVWWDVKGIVQDYILQSTFYVKKLNFCISSFLKHLPHSHSLAQWNEHSGQISCENLQTWTWSDLTFTFLILNRKIHSSCV